VKTEEFDPESEEERRIRMRIEVKVDPDPHRIESVFRFASNLCGFGRSVISGCCHRIFLALVGAGCSTSVATNEIVTLLNYDTFLNFYIRYVKKYAGTVLLFTSVAE
jgi:hypothetical protein